MADLVLECESCHGKRFKSDTLEVKFNDKSIYDVLEMTVNQAIEFFNEHGTEENCEEVTSFAGRRTGIYQIRTGFFYPFRW